MDAKWFARIGRWDFSETPDGEIVVRDLPPAKGDEGQPEFAKLSEEQRAEALRQIRTIQALRKRFSA